MERVDWIHDPEAEKSDLVSAFTEIIGVSLHWPDTNQVLTYLCQGTHFDPDVLTQHMKGFEDIATKVNDLSNQSADFVLSAVKGVVAKRSTMGDEARNEKSRLRDLEKKLSYAICSSPIFNLMTPFPVIWRRRKPAWFRGLSDPTTPTVFRSIHLLSNYLFVPAAEEKEKLKKEIADSKAKIHELDSTVEALFAATTNIRAIGDKVNSETKDIIQSLHLGPKQIASTLAKCITQVKPHHSMYTPH